MKPKRLMITEKIGELDVWSDLCGSFDSIIDKLKEYKICYQPKKDEEIFVDYIVDDDDNNKLVIFRKRYENDKEYNKRIKKIEKEKGLLAKSKDRQKKNELKEYERLKKKHG